MYAVPPFPFSAYRHLLQVRGHSYTQIYSAMYEQSTPCVLYRPALRPSKMPTCPSHRIATMPILRMLTLMCTMTSLTALRVDGLPLPRRIARTVRT